MKRCGGKSRDRGGIFGALASAFDVPPSLDYHEGYYVQVSRQAMACHFEALVLSSDRVYLPAVLQALDEVQRIESILSVYRDDSEVSRVNREAGGGPVTLGPELFELLRLSQRLGRQTKGAFDVTVGTLIRCWGFFCGKGRVPEAEELTAARRSSGWEMIELDESSRSVRFRRRGVELNFGSIGKGYALGCAAGILKSAGLTNFLLSAGGSSVVVEGSSASGPGWDIALRDPWSEGARWGMVRLSDQAISTSGSGTRFFIREGRRWGHILDPRTGWPVEHHCMCSVVAPDPATAEALSTAMFVMSNDELEKYPAVSARIGAIVFGSQDQAQDCSPRLFGMNLDLKPEARC